MTVERDVTQAVRSWLELGTVRLPDRVLDAVLEEVPTIRQRRRGWSSFGLSRRVLLAAAAALMSLALAVAFLPLRPGSGPGTRMGPSPTPSVSPSPPPTPSVAVQEVPSSGAMDGRYVYSSIGGTGVAVEFSTPPNWLACCGGFTENLDGNTQFAPWVVGLVHPDPCHRSEPPVAVGETVEELVAALAAQPGRVPARPSPSASVAPSEPVTTTVSGFRAVRLQIQVPFEPEFSACTSGRYVAFSGRGNPDEERYNQVPGQIDDLWIVDVDGTAVTLLTSYLPSTSQARRAELQALIDSVVIRPPPLAGPSASFAPTEPPRAVPISPSPSDVAAPATAEPIGQLL